MTRLRSMNWLVIKPMLFRSRLSWFRCVGVWFSVYVLAIPTRAADGNVSLENMVQRVQHTAGVCVQLGGGDGSFSARLAAGGRLILHVLEADEVRVKTARQNLQAHGLGGVVSVEHWTAASLPYANNLVNVLVAENAGMVPESEMMRVLAPNGVLWMRQDDGWSQVRKPWPKEFDEWTHWRHGADGNMVSHDLTVGTPTGLRWVAGPPQDTGGRKWYYDHVLVSAHGRNFYAYENEITARDAFNGALLWKRPLKGYSFRETGTEVPEFLQLQAKVATRLSKVRPVAAGERLYVASEGKLLALDAATGETAAELGVVVSPREILVEGNTLVFSETNVVRAYDLVTGQTRWTIPLATERIVIGDGSLFCLSSNVISSFELATGKERWRTENPELGPGTTCTYHQGVFVVESSSWRDDGGGCGILVHSGKDGRLLWKKEYKPDMTHWNEARSFFARSLLWLQTEKNKVVGFDPITGKQQQSWGSRGKHCSTPVATERYFIAAECEFTDWMTGSRTRARMFKSACRLPFVPANGLLYSFPVQCECFPMLRGYMGLASDPVIASPKTPQIKRGPAFGRAPAANPDGASPSDWPMYRRDAYRSGSTLGTLPAGELACLWTATVAEPPKGFFASEWQCSPFIKGVVTPPVVTGNAVFVAVPDEHRVVSLDASTGRIRWSFIAGGRIDLPPTLHEDLCLFGAHDGWVYCLNTADGELVWQFQAAPRDTRITAYGQMESLWPVPGSILVDQGVAYFAAGRHPLSDGGLHVFALKPRTGEIVWQTPLSRFVLSSWYGPALPNSKKYVGYDFEPVDILVKDGDSVAMSRWRFDPAKGGVQLSLASTAYEAPGLTVPRGLWGYGIRQTKLVLQKPAAVFDRTRIHTGTTNDAALLLTADGLVTTSTSGLLTAGNRTLQLESAPVHDGLAYAGQRIYASTQTGKLLSIGVREK